MIKMQIRAASSRDVAQIVEITNAAYAKYIPRMGRKPQPMTADYAKLVAAGEVWVACDAIEEPSVAGLIVLQAAKEHLLIYSVAVHPARQGMGIGKRLLSFAEQRAAALHYDVVQLYTNEKMVENIALYARVGYVEVRRTPYRGFQVVYMEKNVNESQEQVGE